MRGSHGLGRRVIASVALVGLFVLGGCTVVTADAPPSESPSTAAATAGPSELGTDPCDIVDPAELVEGPGLAELAWHSRQPGRASDFLTCELSGADLRNPIYAYGYFVQGTRGFDQAHHYAIVIDLSDYRQLDLADEAFITQGAAYARVGDVAFGVESTVLTQEELEDGITELVEHVDVDIRPSADGLPESCPAADDPLVAPLLGAIVSAQGSDEERIGFCRYVDDEWRELTIKSIPRSPEETAVEIEREREFLDPEVGEEGAVSTGDPFFLQTRPTLHDARAVLREQERTIVVALAADLVEIDEVDLAGPFREFALRTFEDAVEGRF